MKNILRIIAAALLVTGCAQQEQMEIAGDGQSPVFTASFEDAATKTYLDSGHKLLWTADDRLSIFINTYNQQYRYTGESGKTSADFEEVKVSEFHSGNTLSTNYAVYPYMTDTEIANDGTITCTLPAVQPYAEGSFGLGANTMVAVTSSPDDYFLPFRNLCGYLVVKLYGEGTVKSISIKVGNGEKIAGKATVIAEYGNDPQTTMSETATGCITVDCGESGAALGTSSDASTEFWFCIPPVTFSKGFTVTVTDMDGKTFEKSVSSSRTITRNVINSLSALNVEFSSDTPVPGMVDLGLPSGLKWASFNLGASKPEDVGGYYQWGGLEDVTDTSIYLDLDNCPYHTGSSYSTGWTKYVPSDKSSYWSGSGSPDNKTVLDPEDDVANVTLGGKWRIPTSAEFQELLDNCDSEGTTLNGINGIKFTSAINGNSIFLPAAGCRSLDGLYYAGSYGLYWSSSLSTDYPRGAYYLYFDSDDVSTLSYADRCVGRSVRPVYGDRVSVNGVTLNKTSLSLAVGAATTLSATVTPSNAAERSVSWSSSNPSVATVDAKGKVTALNSGSAIITVETTDGGFTATCQVTITLPEMVDLGLPSGLKWASFNLGASKPEEYGGYYQWGGLEDVTDTSIYLDWDNCPYHTGSSRSTGWTKYVPSDKSSYWSGSGSPDNKTVLDPEDDVAHVILGGKWRIPTSAEFQELLDNCDSEGTTLNGINGIKFTSAINGNSIFLPAAGYLYRDLLDSAGSYGNYWSSSLGTDYPIYAYILYFSSDRVYTNSYYRYGGRSVRPVSE